MLINTIRNILFFLTLIFPACIEPFFINEGKTVETLVVEGMITNDPGPYTIYLSKTTSASDPQENPFINAEVKITDDHGYEETFSQNEPGVYITDSLGIQGIVGRKYKIIIETTEGDVYESEYSELKESLPIDDFYCHFELNHDFITGRDTEGYRFYTEFKPYTEKETYLMWLSEETYEHEAPFSIDYIYIGYIVRYENPDTFKTCWNTVKVKEIVTLFNDPRRNQQSITVRLNHTEIEKFAIKYSLLLKQLSVEEETNKYWKAVNDLNEGQSSFYNKQPYQIRGNIQNINDPNEAVLGYFFAAGISKKRIFQTHPGIETQQCLPDFDGMRFLRFEPSNLWPIWIVNFGGGRLARGDDYCFDCRLKGGSIIKPDFW